MHRAVVIDDLAGEPVCVHLRALVGVREGWCFHAFQLLSASSEGDVPSSSLVRISGPPVAVRVVSRNWKDMPLSHAFTVPAPE